MKKINKVCLDPGHGGSAPGAVYRGLMEKNVTLQVALIVKALLLKYGHEIVMTRERDEDVSLSNRCKIANSSMADIFISIHCNADPDPDEPGMPEARGEEIWIYDDSSEGLNLADCLKGYMDRIFPKEPFRGIKSTTGLYVLKPKHIKMPAVLIEMGFIDKSSSVEMFSNFNTIKNIGRFIADGIHEYFSLT